MDDPHSHASVPSVSLEWPRVILVMAAFIGVGQYMLWRLGTFNPEAPIFSVILYLAEVFGVVTMLQHLFMTWRLSVRQPPEPEEGHSVDVFIPTINEPLSIVRRTALTALAMDYPHQTWILDDGRRDEIRALAEELGCGYIARPDNQHAKAGNLNYALALTQGEFIALFDADHAPKKTFLTRTLGYFRDGEVAFVQTPQDFYNLDSYQHRAAVKRGQLWSEQSLFFRLIQRGKDVWNAAFFCGSCAIIRRSALLEIGGFATGTVTEDIHTSIRLHKAGFKSVYHCESLAFGIAAAQIEPFLKQRIRWGQGAMQVWKQESLVLTSQLTLAQKICYTASILTYFEGWQRMLYYTIPVIVLFTGWVPIETDATDFLLHFVPYFILMLWCFDEVGRGFSRALIIEQYNMARFAAFAYATLGLFKKNLRFDVTNKKLVSVAPYSLYLLPQYAIFFLNALAVPLGMLLYNSFHHLSSFALTANIMWAVFNLVLAAMVLIFSLARVGFQRHDYRFTLPLTAELNFGGEPVYCAVDDLSSSGMLLFIPGDLRLTEEQMLKGTLHIPGDTIPFSAIVRATRRRRRGDEVTTIGCQFLWEHAHAVRNRLELFLYGSDLELHVNHISERKPTLLERVLPIAWHELEPRPAYENGYDKRVPMMYKPSALSIEPGMLAINGRKGRNMAMVFSPMPIGSQLEMRVFTQQGWQTVHARIEQENKVEYLHPTMYFYELSGAAA